MKLALKRLRLQVESLLCYKDIVKIINDIKNIDDIQEITITTNGLFLKEYLEDLVVVGLDAINISLDVVDKDLYRYITRGGNVSDVLIALDVALDYEKTVVKINSVLISIVNDSQIIPLVYLAKERQIAIKFIELMPMGIGKNIFIGGVKPIIKELIYNKPYGHQFCGVDRTGKE